MEAYSRLAYTHISMIFKKQPKSLCEGNIPPLYTSPLLAFCDAESLRYDTKEEINVDRQLSDQHT